MAETSSQDHQPTSFLSLPNELRNIIYHHHFHDLSTSTNISTRSNPLALLQTCHTINSETQLLALHHIPLRLRTRPSTHETTYPRSNVQSRTEDTIPDPAFFKQHTALLPACHHPHLRTIILTTPAKSLRAMTETWQGRPFGSEELRLKKLVLVALRSDFRPRRSSGERDAEIGSDDGHGKGGGGGAGLERVDSGTARTFAMHDCHRLAHAVSETVKGLRGVEILEVWNGGYGEDGDHTEDEFDMAQWKLFWRGLIYRLWKWGGRDCGIGMEGGGEDGKGMGRCMRLYLWDSRGGGWTVGEEVDRLQL